MPADLFIGCDWGTSSFRLRLVERASRRIVEERSSSRGIKSFAALPASGRSKAFADYFATQLASLPDAKAETPIIISGMASSNVGWRELPYAVAPFRLDGTDAVLDRVSFHDADGRSRDAVLVSGVRTPDDVMRGEECALIGAQVLRPALASAGRVLCLLAGTHPKHVRLERGALASFRTHLTGELFDLLSRESLLSAAVDRAALEAAPDLDAFSAGVNCAREHGVSGALFQVRARNLTGRALPAANAWFLSGILIGGELERVVAEGCPGHVVLIGDAMRVRLYREALRALGAAAAAGHADTLPLTDAIVAGQQCLLAVAGA